MYLIAGSAIGETIWKGSGGVALLEEVTGVWCHLRFKNPMLLPVSLPHPIVLDVSTCGLSDSVCLLATALSGAVRYSPEKTARTQFQAIESFIGQSEIAPGIQDPSSGTEPFSGWAFKHRNYDLGWYTSGYKNSEKWNFKSQKTRLVHLESFSELWASVNWAFVLVWQAVLSVSWVLQPGGHLQSVVLGSGAYWAWAPVTVSINAWLLTLHPVPPPMLSISSSSLASLVTNRIHHSISLGWSWLFEGTV